MIRSRHLRLPLTAAAATAVALCVAGPASAHVHTDPSVPAPDSGAWWDVPVAEVSESAATRQARAAYEEARKQRLP